MAKDTSARHAKVTLYHIPSALDQPTNKHIRGRASDQYRGPYPQPDELLKSPRKKINKSKDTVKAT